MNRLPSLFSRTRRVARIPPLPQIRHASSSPTPQQTRISRINARLPRFLRRFTAPLSSAPVSHITAFLLLHEITAIVPLIALATTFHYTHWLPPYITEGAWVRQGIEKFGKYFRRKGWLGEEGGVSDKRWWVGESGVRVVVEVATAWAVTKALLPLRLVVSVWGTPWFARVAILPVTGWVGKVFGRTRVGSAAGTGATGGRVLPKDVSK